MPVCCTRSYPSPSTFATKLSYLTWALFDAMQALDHAMLAGSGVLTRLLDLANSSGTSHPAPPAALGQAHLPVSIQLRTSACIVGCCTVGARRQYDSMLPPASEPA